MSQDLLNKLMSYSVTSNELTDAMNKQAIIMKYSEFIEFGLFKIFAKTNFLILLVKSPMIDMQHYICVLMNHKNKSIIFYDSYGMNFNELSKLMGIDSTFFNNQLYSLADNLKYKIDINTRQMQKMDDKINTCGRWVLMRAQYNNMSNKEFNNMIIDFCGNTYKPDEIITLMTMSNITEPIKNIYGTLKNENLLSRMRINLLLA